MKYFNQHIIDAYKVLDGKQLTEEEALQLINTEPPYLMDLYSLAAKVTQQFATGEFDTCQITNVKSGACSEDCSFCAQSKFHETEIDVYPLRGEDEILEQAINAKKNGARAFCLVASGYGYKESDEEFQKIINSVKAIIAETDLEVHVSIGMLSDETATELKKAGVEVVNHNLESSADFYKTICTTHQHQERVDTVTAVKNADMKICTGGILGLGETSKDRVELAMTLQKLNADYIPINMFKKIQGTANKEKELTLRDILNTIAVFRLTNPTAIIKLAAGRESILRDFQGLAFQAGANGMLIGGYLTIRGRDVSDDNAMLNALKSLSL